MKNILLTCFSLFVIVAFTSCSLTMNKNESELDRFKVDDFKISFNPSEFLVEAMRKANTSGKYEFDKSNFHASLMLTKTDIDGNVGLAVLGWRTGSARSIGFKVIQQQEGGNSKVIEGVANDLSYNITKPSISVSTDKKTKIKTVKKTYELSISVNVGVKELGTYTFTRYKTITVSKIIKL